MNIQSIIEGRENRFRAIIADLVVVAEVTNFNMEVVTDDTVRVSFTTDKGADWSFETHLYPGLIAKDDKGRCRLCLVADADHHATPVIASYAWDQTDLTLANGDKVRLV